MDGWIDRQIDREVSENWFTGLWRLRSPVMCCPQAGGLGRPGVWLSTSLKTSDLGKLIVLLLVKAAGLRNWRACGGRGGMVQVLKSTGRRTWRANVQLKKRSFRREKERERMNLLFLCLLVLFGPSAEWMVPAHIR